MKKILAGVGIVSVLVISIVSFFDIDLAIQIAVNAIIVSLLIGILVYIGNLFGKGS